MQEFEINELWKKNEKHASEYYSKIENKIMDLAKKNSNSILQKIKNRILLEWLISFVVTAYVFYTFRNHPNLYVLIISVLILGIFIWLPYGKVLSKIKTVSTQNVVNSLETYVDILNEFMRHLKNTFLIITPILLILGIYMVGNTNSSGIFEYLQTNLTRITLAVVFLVIFMILAYKFLFPAIYGNPKKELEDLLTSLKE